MCVSYPAPSANIQEPAPGFKAKAVVDGEIVDVSTEDYKGKWLVLLFYPKVFYLGCGDIYLYPRGGLISKFWMNDVGQY